ncbi:MAG: hypothetical protein ABIH39_04580 [Candidatus Margulisiibacteriota bacterium]
MVIIRKIKLMAVLIIMFCAPVYAGFWDGLGGFLMDIGVGSAVPADLKQAYILKKQYDELGTIKSDLSRSTEEMENIRRESEESNEILRELQRFIDNPDRIYKLATNQRYREEYLLSFTYRDLDGNENPALKNIVKKLYQTGSIDLFDLEKLYRLYTLDEEEQLIRRLQDVGVSRETILSIAGQQRKNRERKDALKRKLEEKIKMDIRIAELEKEIELYTEKYNEESCSKQKTEYKQMLLSLELNLQTCRARLMSKELATEKDVTDIKQSNVDINIQAYHAELTQRRKALAKQDIAAIDKYYEDRKGTSGIKMGRFTRFISRYFIKLGNQ